MLEVLAELVMHLWYGASETRASEEACKRDAERQRACKRERLTSTRPASSRVRPT